MIDILSWILHDGTRVGEAFETTEVRVKMATTQSQTKEVAKLLLSDPLVLALIGKVFCGDG